MDLSKVKLIKISSYARIKDVSVAAVYKWEKAGKIEVIEIDGVKFVKVEE